MKTTPMQELIETFEEMRSPIDSKVEVDFAISLAKSLLEKEKEVMCEFAYTCRNVMAADQFAINRWYDKTFNTSKSGEQR